MTIEVRVLTGAVLDAALEDVARLRIAVFRDWPYLYGGSFDYEHAYLQRYRDSEDAVLVGAFDAARLVGAATGVPLEDHAAEFAAAFAAQPMGLNEVFYCAESVLLPQYRGQGIGHRFFDLREAAARSMGRGFSAFCAVMRPADHPARPADYVPLDGFWGKRGYAPMAGVVAGYAWQDLGEAEESEKPMQFWMKSL